MIEKQAGTVALPMLVTAHTAADQAALWTSARTDRRLTYVRAPDGLKIDGPADASVRESFARSAAFARGLRQWQASDQAGAVRVWQEGNALDHVLDHVRLLAAGGSTDAALALAERISAVAQDGRASFEQATLLEATGDLRAADRLYQQAAQRSPEHPLAQLTWVRRLAMTNQAIPDVQQVSPASTAVLRWRSAAEDLEETGDLADAIAHMSALRHLNADDGETGFIHAGLLQRAELHEAASAGYEALRAREDVWGQLARARLAQLADRRPEATALYVGALPLATTAAIATRIGDGLRDLDEVAAAVRAYEQAATLEPESIWPLVSAGNMLRSADPVAARVWYERARRLDPGNGYPFSGYPDFALGRMLEETGDPQAALPFLETAVAKEPASGQYRDLLEQVRAQLGRSPHAPPATAP